METDQKSQEHHDFTKSCPKILYFFSNFKSEKNLKVLIQRLHQMNLRIWCHKTAYCVKAFRKRKTSTFEVNLWEFAKERVVLIPFCKPSTTKEKFLRI